MGFGRDAVPDGLSGPHHAQSVDGGTVRWSGGPHQEWALLTTWPHLSERAGAAEPTDQQNCQGEAAEHRQTHLGHTLVIDPSPWGLDS